MSSKPLILVVDPHHWLAENGTLPMHDLRLRRRALRVARLIEYGGPLERGQGRDTLVECTRRPGGQPCLGLMWVEKQQDDILHAYCQTCESDEIFVQNWQDTRWADGPMDPVDAQMMRAMAQAH